MTDGIDVDFSEVMKLAATLAIVPVRAIPNVVTAVKVTAHHVKDDWKEDVPSIASRGSRKYESSISYDMKLIDGSIGAEIGPVLGKPGGSFGLLEDGGSGVRSAPQHSGRDAAKKNEADFIKGLSKALADGEREAGL